MRRFLALIPVLLVLGFGLLWLNPSTRQMAWRLSDENHLIELSTFLALFAGGLLGLGLTRSLVRAEASWRLRIFYAVFSLGLLVVAMEEIAWGQWFLGFETPAAIRWRNKQGELTLHNIGSLHGNADLLRLAFSIGGLIGFGLRRTPIMRGIAPPAACVPWFAVILVCAGLERLMEFEFVRWSPDIEQLLMHVMPELIEMLIGVCALLYVWIHRRRFALGERRTPSPRRDRDQ